MKSSWTLIKEQWEAPPFDLEGCVSAPWDADSCWLTEHIFFCGLPAPCHYANFLVIRKCRHIFCQKTALDPCFCSKLCLSGCFNHFRLVDVQYHQLNAKTLWKHISVCRPVSQANRGPMRNIIRNSKWQRVKYTEKGNQHKLNEPSKHKMRHRLRRERGEDLSLRLITPLIACQVLT